MLDLVLSTPPAEAPVTLDEARLHVRGLDTPEDDALIQGLIAAAVESLDGYTGTLGRALITQTWRLHLPAFPGGSIPLPLPPVQSVASVTYLDAAGATQTLPTSDYWTHDGRWPAIDLVDGKSWPSTARHRRAVTVTFVAGYGVRAAVPAPIKAALLLMIGDLYQNREGGTENAAVKALLAPYRRIGV